MQGHDDVVGSAVDDVTMPGPGAPEVPGSTVALVPRPAPAAPRPRTGRTNPPPASPPLHDATANQLAQTAPPAGATPRRGRRRLPGTAVAVAVAGALVAAAAGPPAPDRPRPPAASTPAADPAYAQIPLYQEGVTVLPGGIRVSLPPGTDPVFLPGSRVVDPAATTLARAVAGRLDAATVSRADAQVAAAEQRAWLAAGTVPGAGGAYDDMARTALLDLHTLLLPRGAAVAGWSARWRYVWPRDAAFVAVALARTGHQDDALDVLGFLDTVQGSDGRFEARYLPDGSGTPDDRGIQIDGTGWALWAAGLVVAEIDDPDERQAAAQRLRPLVVRSTARAVHLVGSTGLPPASPDYWEVPEVALTLGTVAPLVAGLQQAEGLLRLTGDDGLASSAADAAHLSRTAVIATFGLTGYARYATGGHADAASAFLLPPFLQAAPSGALEAWTASAPTMLRPASGLAPGAGWRDDGVSWTPQTALYAWVAAEGGDAGLAGGWLDFLDSHRTATGSIPEKVLADGSPAAVAPLAWSAASTVLALDALDELG